jgi:hypothetical protein
MVGFPVNSSATERDWLICLFLLGRENTNCAIFLLETIRPSAQIQDARCKIHPSSPSDFQVVDRGGRVALYLESWTLDLSKTMRRVTLQRGYGRERRRNGILRVS